MRNAHRPKALPSRKLPRGIERQDELIELIERRFHQEDLIRDALRHANATDGDTSAEDGTSAEIETASAATAEGAPTANDSTAPNDKTAVTTSETRSTDTKDGTAPDAVTIRWHGQHETITDPLVWLTVFDTVREAGDVVTREIADRRFHGESYWKTCDALYLSTGTYYHHVRAILHYAFACAVYHRLIDPRPKHRRPKAK